MPVLRKSKPSPSTSIPPVHHHDFTTDVLGMQSLEESPTTSLTTAKEASVSMEDVLVSSPWQVSAMAPRWISWRRLHGECLHAISEADVLAPVDFLASPDVCISTTKKPASLSRWFIYRQAPLS
jgi:hypothetical protein